MKTSKFTGLAAAIILCALAMAACSGGAGNANNANSNANSNTAANKNAATTQTTTNTSAGGDYSTPTAAFKSFYEAAKSNNVEGMKRSISKKSLDFIQKEADKEKKTLDDAFKEMNKGAPAAAPEIRNEKIEGDKATIEMKDDKMDKWTSVPFVKEDGHWKIAMFDEAAAMMEKLDALDSEKK